MSHKLSESELTQAKERVGKVAVISSYANFGGAARAAIRHHQALLAAGVESTMVSMQSDAPSDGTHAVVQPDAPKGSELEQLRAAVNRSTIESNRTGITTTHFSWPTHGVDLTTVRAILEADTLSIHWVSGMMTITMLERLAGMRKRIVLTLHDEWMYTGGCHYSFGCEGFVSNCQQCPQLISDPFGVPARVLSRRAEAGNAVQGTVVTPSQWLSGSASRSRAFRSWNHAVIPYAIDTELFKPKSKSKALDELGFDTDRAWITMVTSDRDERKGGDVLVRAAELARSTHGICDSLGFLLIGECGSHQSELERLGYRVKTCTRPDDLELVRWYAAGTCMVLPTLADNLPNTMLESLACGRPVIGSDIGGVPDFVISNETGVLFPIGDAESLASILIRVAHSPEEFDAMGESCRALMESRCDPIVHASAWIQTAAESPISSSVTIGDDSGIRNGVLRMLTQCTAQGLALQNDTDHPQGEKIDQLACASQARRAIAQRDELARRLQSAQNTLSREHEESIKAIGDLRSELAQSRSLAHKQHETLGVKADQIREHFESKLSELQSKLNETIREEQRANHSSRVSQLEIDKLRGVVANANAMRDSIEESLNRVKDDLDGARKSNANLAQQRDDSIAALASARGAHAAAREQLEEFKSRLEKLTQQYHDLQQSRDDLERDHQRINTSLTRQTQALNALEQGFRKPFFKRLATSIAWVLTGQWHTSGQSSDET